MYLSYREYYLERTLDKNYPFDSWLELSYQ